MPALQPLNVEVDVQQAPEVTPARPSVENLVADILQDARQQPTVYLNETVVPKGGE